MEEFEYSGKWWLPEIPDGKMFGTLRFDPEKNIKLELKGPFKDIDKPNTIQNPKIILGETSNGKQVTLYKCYGSTPIFPISFWSEISLVISFVFIGHHFEKEEDIIFDTMSLNYSNLDEWVGINGLSAKWGESPQGYSYVSRIDYIYPQKIEIQLKDFNIALNYMLSFNGITRFEYKLKQTNTLKIETFKPTDFHSYMNICNNFQNFLSLAEGEAVYPLSIKAETKECQTTLSSGEIVYNDISIFYPIRGCSKSTKKLISHDMLFSFQDISADFEKYLNNWFSKAENLKPVYDLYFGTLYNSPMYLQHAFSSLIQAVETYHRRAHGGKYLEDDNYSENVLPIFIESIPETLTQDFRESLKGKFEYLNEFSLRKRLQEILKSFGNLTDHIIENKRIFIEDVVDTRNYFTHFDKKLEKKAKKGKELYILTQQIKFVLEVCLLKELGLPDVTIETVMSRNQRYIQLWQDIQEQKKIIQ